MSWPQPQVRTHYITCTTKALWNGHLVITHLSGYGETWAYRDVISAINSGLHNFFTYDGMTTAEIQVLPGAFGPYLKTVSDGVITNNLEELTAC